MTLFTATTVFSCGRNEVEAPLGDHARKPLAPEASAIIVPGTVVAAVDIKVQLSIESDGSLRLSSAEPLNLTVPSATTLTVSSFLNASAGSTMGREDFGYFNVAVKNNSNSVWNKTDIYVSVRFAAAGSQFQSPDAVLTTYIDKPLVGSEAETVTAIPVTATAGAGVRAGTICNAAAGACAAKPAINQTLQNLRIQGDFGVPAGTYTGTLTFELTTAL